MPRISTIRIFSYDFRHSWLALYVAINVIATYIMLRSRELIGDAKGGTFQEDGVLFAAFLIIGLYIILLWPVFNYLYRIKVAPFKLTCSDVVIGDRVGWLVLVLQLLYMASNLFYGLNIAGAGNIQSGNKLTYIFILLDPDYLFFIYYGIYRENKLFVPNLVVYMASNLLRGWNGMFLFILFFETCRSYRSGLLTAKKLTLILVISVAFYPIVSSFKWAIRANAFSKTNVIEIIPNVIDQLGTAEVGELLIDGIEHMVSRLQSVSLLADVMQRSSQLQADFDANKILPFWLEGLHGLIYDRLLLGNIFSGGERMSVGVIYAEYINGFTISDGVGNAAISYPGWFFIAPNLIPFYILYTIFLGGASIYFVKKISKSESAKEMVWLVWLLYLLAPWLGAMVKFIYSAAFFAMIQIVMAKIPNLNARRP